MSRKTLEERFWEKVDKRGPDECWPWTRGTNQDGYGSFYYEGRMHNASRVAFFLEHGRWPEPMACHSCDNPPCCNTAHLFEGTMADNVADRDAKGRCGAKGQRGEAHGASKLTEKAVLYIRGRVLAGHTQQSLADEFGVRQSTIGKIVNRERWRHV